MSGVVPHRHHGGPLEVRPAHREAHVPRASVTTQNRRRNPGKAPVPFAAISPVKGSESVESVVRTQKRRGFSTTGELLKNPDDLPTAS